MTNYLFLRKNLLLGRNNYFIIVLKVFNDPQIRHMPIPIQSGLIIIIASIDGMRRDETDTIARYCRTYL